MIEITIDTNSNEFILPIAPEELEINLPGNNEEIDIIGVGAVKILRRPGLKTFTIDSFIDDYNDSEDFIDGMENWMASGESGDFNASELGINMDVCIDNFSYSRRSGEEERLYYTLQISEYRAYGAKILVIKAEEETTETTEPEENRADNAAPVENIYTVVSGDNLWIISRRLSGNGGNWNELYQSNKAVIGSNPSLIYAGQIYIVPSAWVS